MAKRSGLKAQIIAEWTASLEQLLRQRGEADREVRIGVENYRRRLKAFKDTAKLISMYEWDKAGRPDDWPFPSRARP